MGLTPMMLQYLEIKENAKDCILLFRLGDFYEMFFEDAIIASKDLEIALTGKNCGLEERAPMCGIPFHSAHNYIRTLITKGHKVAICEQVEEASASKGIVKREIVKIYTPGTYTDSQFLKEDKNNFVLSLYVDNDNNQFSLSFGDISTGELYTTFERYNSSMIFNEIAKFMPTEIIFNNGCSEEFILELCDKFSIPTNGIDESEYSKDYSELLQEQFSADEVAKLSHIEKISISSLIHYFKHNLKLLPKHMNNIETYKLLDHLSLDMNSKRNLELTETMKDKSKKGSLLWVLDKTDTSMGARNLRKWIEKPLLDKELINERLDGIKELIENIFIHEDLKESLNDIYDIERLIGKISTGNISPKEMLSLKISLNKIPRVKELLKDFNSPLLGGYFKNIDLLEDISDLLERAIDDNPPITLKEGGIIRDGYDQEIDELREAKKNGKQWIATLEAQEKEALGIRSLKIKYNKVFGYYIEVTKSNIHLVPEGRYVRKQTLANAERYITPELKEVEDKILGAEEKLINREYNLYVAIREVLDKKINRMKSTAKIIANIDTISSLAYVARENNYCKPTFNDNGVIDIKDGRHPVVENMIPKNTFVENNTHVDNLKETMLIITGPNMAGKSTYMRQVALITLMAQIGSYVPASSANISVCDKIFTRIGASDDLASGKSTFMVEMAEVSNILNNATNNSLVLLDEVGRGTSTFDGLSIAWSVIEYMCNNSALKCKTLFATHYHELIQLEGQIPGVKNYSVAIREIDNQLVFLRKVVEGGTDDSYGIEVAKLAGIPDVVINRAKDILKELETGNHSVEKEVAADKTLSESIPVPEKEIPVNNKHESTTEELNSAPFQQLNFDDIYKDNLINEIKNIEILNLTPMDGFNKLYEIIKKAKEI
ncbi:DNA mismatch repair protein MutS [Oceanirhabdus sp. W0125-5]|uniref:DNA mismatch repair protein MutS n=1 Tax=Oceanirhabdus sp. W0125-5 TaxID=2999116 RepID=UPI0022F327CB|nr:DNA mismatch repair protein MutS [Oceanirhabdus sp. W0125-5]WBW95109.1 DNA mismatch repair protein MutS [Oceanirhabdus sp. W0125-5]